MEKLFILAFILSLISCNQRQDNEFSNQIKYDLVNMLHNKASVEKLEVNKIISTGDQTQMIYFDCSLKFTDDLYKENGVLAFRKGTKVNEKKNKFVYIKKDKGLQLISLEFGESEIVTFP